MEEQKVVSRRDAMKVAIWTIGGLIASAIGLPAIAYILGPALKKEEANWIQVSSLSNIEVGNPVLLKPRIVRQDGWIEEEAEVGVYVLTEDGRNYHAMSNICTHLGCRVRWVAERKQFFSPCHNGIFDEHGYVVSGPPPRPLDEYETKIEDGNLYIKLPAITRPS